MRDKQIVSFFANKKAIMFFSFLFCLIVFVGCIKVVPNTKLFCREAAITDLGEQVIPFSNGTEIIQSLEMTFSKISSFKIYTKPEDRNNIGNINVAFTDKANNVLGTWNVREDLLETDGYQTFEFPKLVSVNKGKTYYIKISSNDNDDHTAGLVASLNSVYKKGTLTINGIEQPGDIIFKLVGRNEGLQNKNLFYVLFAGFSILFLFCIYILIFEKVEMKMQTVQKADYLLLGILLILCSTFFSQYSDLEITIKHAEDFISLVYRGQAGTFYDFTLYKALDGGYGTQSVLNAAAYNIFLYIIVSIIILPWVFVRKVFDLSYNYTDIVIYFQIFLMILDIYAAWIMERLCIKLGKSKETAKITAYLFLSSCITIFSTVGFGQLDIIYIIIVIWALLLFAEKKYLPFSFIMSVAIMLKSFPMLLFIPLVLLMNKDIKKIILYLLSGISSTVLFKLFWRNNYGYQITQEKIEAHYHFTDRMFQTKLETGITSIALFVTVYFAICIWAYSKKIETEHELYSYVAFLGLSIFGSFAILVLWHPQWMVNLALFASMAIAICTDTCLALYCDLGMQITYLIIANINWGSSVDNHMVNYGILNRLTSHSYKGITVGEVLRNVNDILPIAFSVFTAILLMYIYFVKKSFPQKNQKTDNMNCSRILVWSRMGILYAYVFYSVIMFFFIG